MFGHISHETIYLLFGFIKLCYKRNNYKWGQINTTNGLHSNHRKALIQNNHDVSVNKTLKDNFKKNFNFQFGGQKISKLTETKLQF